MKVPKRAIFNLSIFILCLSFLNCGKTDKEQLISNALENSEVDWKSRKTENFILYAPEGSHAAENLADLAGKAEATRQFVMEQLQVVKQERPPTLVFLESRDQMKAFTGSTAGGRAVIEENGIFFLNSPTRVSPLRHEMGHLYSWRSWGKPAGYWLSEGVAVYAAGDCAGEDLHAWAAKLALENRLMDFTEMEERENFSQPEPFLQAGSFVKYIMEKYGVLSFRKMWEKGLAASSEATGLEVDALLENWTNHIMQDEFTSVAPLLEPETALNCQ